MSLVVFYVKLAISFCVLYKLLRNTWADRREKNALLLFVIAFTMIVDVRSILIKSISLDLLAQLAELFFMLYFFIRLTGDKAKSSKIMGSFIDTKALFDSEIIEHFDEGVALIRSDTMEILASNAAYQSFLGKDNAFISVQDVVSAILRGEEHIEVTDFHNEKRSIEARLINYGKRYALLYLKDVSAIKTNRLLSEKLKNDMFLSWEQAPYPVMLRTIEGEIVFINEAMAHFLHKSIASLINKPFSEIYNDDEEYVAHQMLHQKLASAEIPYYKDIMKVTYPLRSMGYLERDERLFFSNGARHLLTTGIDVTETYFSELLKASYQIDQLMHQESAQTIYVVADFIHYDILFKERLSGQLQHQMTSLKMFVSGLNDEDQLYFNAIASGRIDFQPRTITYNAVHHFMVEQIFYTSGDHIVGLMMKYLNPDILTFDKAHIGSMIMNHIKEGILIVNGAGAIEYANDMIHRILNYDTNALLGKDIVDITMGLTHEMLSRNMSLSKQHNSLHFERLYVSQDGQHVPTEIIAMNLESERSDLLLLLVRDISEKFIYKKKFLDSQSRYAQIFETLQDSVLEIQLPEKSINIYREFDSEKGLIGLEMSFLQWLNSVHDLDRSIVYEAVDMITSEKSPSYGFEYRYFKNGGWQWLRAIGKYIDTDEGASIFIINQNISEIKSITQKLLESHVILTESERITNMAHWKFLVSKNLFVVSQTFGSVFLYKKEVDEIYFESLLESIYPVDLDFFKFKFEKFIWKNENLDIIFRLHSHGKISYVNMRGQVYLGDDSLPVHAIGSVADVTEKMMTKKWFEESKMLLENVVEQTPMGIIVIRNNGLIEKINTQALEILKMDAKVLERTEDLILHIMMRGDQLELPAIERLFNPTNKTKMEQTLKMKDQTLLKFSSSHMTDADQHYLGTIINISVV